MNFFRWLAALVVASLVLAACGSMQDAAIDRDLELGTSTVATSIVAESDDPALFAAMATVDYWQAEFGPSATCFVARDVPSQTDFAMYVPEPAGSYTWTLAVVTKLGEPGAGVHYLFEDPADDAVLETAGYDQVLLCKVEAEPEPEPEPEDEPEWCSPGFWRNNPMAVADAIAASDPAFAMSDLYSAHFPALTGLKARTLDRLGLPADPTLQQVLDYPQAYGGAAFNDVGDKLSGAHPDVHFTGERVEDSCSLSADASRRN